MVATTIDVHTHFIPQSYLDALAAVGISAKEVGFPLQPWDVGARLDLQERNGIATEILSLSSPGLRYFEGDGKAELCRRLNDELKAINDAHPASFGGLATLPLPDVEATLLEMARAYDELRLDGVIVMTNYGGSYLGDAAFLPVLKELDRRRAVVFVHPTETVGNKELTFGYPAPMVEYPAETTRAVVSLLDADAIARFPGIRWIFSHGGGTLPLLVKRVEELFPWKRGLDPATTATKVLAEIDSLYWDTAIVGYEASLRAIKASHPAARILTGFDLPFYPADQIAEQKQNIADLDVFTPEEKVAIDHGNALELFPQVALRSRRG